MNGEAEEGKGVVGLGDTSFTFAVYIANRPMMPEYQSLDRLMSVKNSDLKLIGEVCGNGWRKVFNVYAKLLYALEKQSFDFSSFSLTWQGYRDEYLLQAGSRTALIFTPPKLEITSPSCASVKTLHIICGRTYAKQLIHEGCLNVDLTWLDDEFAIDLKQAVIICPYFDYRQLSNKKIARLSCMLSGLMIGSIQDLT